MAKKKMSFYEALQLTLEGERITRVEWNDEGVYGFMMNGILTLRREFKFHQWIVTEGDIIAEDWYVI